MSANANPTVLPPAARNSDPASSHVAAAAATASGRRAAHRRIAADAVAAHPGATSRELTAYCDLDRYELARRLPDAEAAGGVARGAPRRCALGGRAAVTWWPAGDHA